MSTFKIGDKVIIGNLILDEPCSEVEQLRNKVGTVLNPEEPDTDYDGNPVVKVFVKLDEQVFHDDEFVFLPEELALRYSEDEHRTCDRNTFACPVVGPHDGCESF